MLLRQGLTQLLYLCLLGLHGNFAVFEKSQLILRGLVVATRTDSEYNFHEIEVRVKITFFI